MTSYSHREAVNQSRQPQPLGVYKNQASRPSPQVVQPQQSVISSTQSTQSNLQTTNLFYENAVNKDSEIQLSLEDRQALMKETNNADSLDIISVEEVVSTQETGSSRNLSQADVSDLSQRPISSDKSHVCMTCYKAFKNKPQLTQHELVHNGIRKHTCSYCEKSFKQLCHLNQHIRTHTGKCQWCHYKSGPGRSKLTTSLVNVSLKFQTLIFQIPQHFLLKKCVKLLHCKSCSHFFSTKNICIWL